MNTITATAVEAKFHTGVLVSKETERTIIEFSKTFTETETSFEWTETAYVVRVDKSTFEVRLTNNDMGDDYEAWDQFTTFEAATLTAYDMLDKTDAEDVREFFQVED